ncbi:MAG: pseudouridine synthase [Patescibacteria group bacterium]|jgi:23S rRNA pseudouridine2605 synthase/23S rRNA pseudouridine2604 synthase
MAPTRLQKFIASTGIVSRRKAETLITDGRVFVNGEKVTKLGTTINPAVDMVEVNGQMLTSVTDFRYIACNKPVGVTCTRAQYQSERTVYQLIPDARDLVIAGRLDKDSEGLVLLTNDGELTNLLTHPRYEHEKEYEVTLSRPLSTEADRALTEGIKLKEGMAKFDRIERVSPQIYHVTLHQGWNRQVRRMFGQLQGDVLRLRRIRMNKLTLGRLQPGAWKAVQRADIL